MATHYCKHRHTYLSHVGCYENDHAINQKVGFLDIETSNLAADFGIILSYCIKVAGTDEILQGVITREDINTTEAGFEDRRVVAQLVEDIKKFDKIVTFYGKRFDIPFTRTRAVACGIEFPPYGSLVHTDLYFVIRSKFKLSSNRLENACRQLLGKTQKTRIDSKYWRGGQRGDEKSLAYILKHNIKDVLDLEKLYNRTIGFVRKQETSL